jgi:hypothetical protein
MKRPQPAVDCFKTIFSVHSLCGGAEVALDRFAHTFGYPVEALSKDSAEVSALREQGFVNTDRDVSYGILPSDVLDVALLHDEWASFTNSDAYGFTIFSLKRSSGQWQPHGVLASSEPKCR